MTEGERLGEGRFWAFAVFGLLGDSYGDRGILICSCGEFLARAFASNSVAAKVDAAKALDSCAFSLFLACIVRSKKSSGMRPSLTTFWE